MAPNESEKLIVIEINKKIALKGSDNERPIYQVVWSDSEREMRLGTFNEFAGKIFLRTVSCVKSVPKYAYIHSRWILEKFAPPGVHPNPELPFAWQGTYEPKYIFETGNGQALCPRLDICEYIIYTDQHPWEKAKLRAYLEDLMIADEKQEYKDNRELLDANGRSEFGDRINSGGLILNAGTPQEMKQ